MKKQIIGAGLAGLIAGCAIPDAEILEAGERNEKHKALLRFRSRAVSEATGIPFKEVIARKGIYDAGVSSSVCSINQGNRYARKVTGLYCGRSIWNLDPEKRFIAPENFYDLLVDKLEKRIQWKTKLNRVDKNAGIQRISTAPLPIMMKACGLDVPGLNFERSEIEVRRYRLPPGTDLYQTIYFPEESIRTFRASITGDILIVESVTSKNPRDFFDWTYDDKNDEMDHVSEAFGIIGEFPLIDHTFQEFGKIIELNKDDREAILFQLTRDFNVFSIGRFATWRNIILDDVVNDIDVVKHLLAASEYGRARVTPVR